MPSPPGSAGSEGSQRRQLGVRPRCDPRLAPGPARPPGQALHLRLRTRDPWGHHG